MGRSIAAASADFYKPNASSVTVSVSGGHNGDLKHVDVKTRLRDLIDTGTIEIQNDNGTYTGQITSGDKVVFSAEIAMLKPLLVRSGETYTVGSGDTEYYTDVTVEDSGTLTINGELVVGLTTVEWTGIVRTPEHVETGSATQELHLDVEDFVFSLLDERYVVNSFEDTQLSGTSESVLNTILANNAPEIGRGQIEAIQRDTNVVWNSRKLLECVRQLADRGDALVGHDGEDMIFRKLDAPEKVFDLQPSDRGLMTATENDDDLKNEIRVNGGQATNVDDEQTMQSSTETVTASNRITQQVTTRKSEIAIVEIYTKKTGSGDNLVVRIQSDDGGSPKDVSSRASDVARKTLASNFLDDDGFSTFLMPDHSLADPNPHIIVESDGSSGQDVGTDGSGNLTYKAHYPYPLDSVVQDEASINEYRRRERPIRAPETKTKPQTEARGNAELRHSKDPTKTVSFPAQSVRAHELDAGDLIGIAKPAMGAQGDYLVMEVAHEYNGDRNELTTNITAQDVTTI